MPAGKRGLSGHKVLMEWLEATADPIAREQMLLWAQLVCTTPEDWYHFAYMKGRRHVFAADVPSTGARVHFIVVDYPARVVHLIAITPTPDP